MVITSIVESNHDAFLQLCKRHKISKLYAFGSAITPRFDPVKSDIDLLVTLNVIDPVEYGELLLSLWDDLEIFFDKKIDLLTEESISNPYLRKSVDSSKKLIYDGQGEKIFV